MSLPSPSDDDGDELQRSLTRLLVNLNEAIDKDNFYEAHQLVRTITFRYQSADKVPELEGILMSTAQTLLGTEQSEIGSDVALQLIKLYLENKIPVEEERMLHLTKLVEKMRDSLERTMFVLNTMEWVGKNFEMSQGFHSTVARIYMKQTVGTVPPNGSPDLVLETGDNLRMMLNNNIGCCQYSMGKPTVAAWFFQKAFYESNRAKQESHKYEIMYNFGVSLLHAKQSLEAFNVLTLCQTAFPSNPRFWLRIAECCVQLYKSTNADDLTWTEEKRNMLIGVETEPDSHKKDAFSNEAIDLERPKPTLYYALHSLQMALQLLNASPSPDSTSVDQITDPREIALLRVGILSTGAYVTLTLGCYDDTVKLSNELLGIVGLPNIFQYLGRLYLCEAVFKQGKSRNSPELFSEMLLPLYEGRSSSPASSSHPYKPPSEWAPHDEMSAKAIMVYNKAVAYASLNHYEQAAAVIDEWKGSLSHNGHSLPPDFVFLQIHVLLKLGDIDKAHQIFRLHCPDTSKCSGNWPTHSEKGSLGRCSDPPYFVQ